MSTDPARWARVRQLLEEALERPESDRASFVDAACQSDDALHREVASLIAAVQTASNFIEQPPQWSTSEAGSLEPGTQFERYRIVSLLGRGGMGDVYLAEDLELRRRVALKFLPADVAGDSGRLRRFEQEARAVSTLSHPNIITIHEIRREPSPFLVTEYVEGQTLAEQLAVGPLDLRTALDEAIQIAAALAAAHAAGIVHRDVKPENVMVRSDGLVKVLDFGLAKHGPVQIAPGGKVGLALTNPGTVMGTTSYMSPEQARGLTVDARSDLFSFGVLLYEMVSGSRPFSGVNMFDVLASVLAREPRPIRELRPDAPDGLQPIVDKLLCKDAAERYHSADAALTDLKTLQRELESASRDDRPVAASSARPTGIFVRSRWIAASVVSGIVVVAAVATYLAFKPSSALTDTDSILLTNFVNRTGDAALDDILRQALLVQLEQSPFLSIFPDSRVRATLRSMKRPDDRVTPEAGREVAQRLGIKALLAGSIHPMGSRYLVALEAIDPKTGDVVAREQQEALGKEHVLRALATTATSMRQRLGESRASIQKFDVSIEQATTSSLEALNAFNRGWGHTSRGQGREAIPLYERAVELDPNFALAWLQLSGAYSASGQHSLKIAAAEKALSLRGRVSQREQFHITADYYTFVTRDFAKAIQVYEQWRKTYPRDFVPAASLGPRYVSLGMYEAAVPLLQSSLLMDPENPVFPANLGRALLRLNRFDEADAVLRDALARTVDTIQMRRTRFDLAFVRGDTAAMQRAIVEAAGRPDDEYDRAQDQSAIAVFRGRFREAQGWVRRAADLAVRHKMPPQYAAWAIAGHARMDAELGQCHNVTGTLQRALALSRERGVLNGAALALGRCGDIAGAQVLSDEMSAAFPDDERLQEVTLPALRASLLAWSHQPTRVLDVLRPSSYTAGFESDAFMAASLRGQAFLDLGNGVAASGEFQRIVDHRGWAPKSSLWPLAHLGLARALAMTGDRVASRTRYEQFFELWKDADSDASELIDAKREFLALAKKN